MSQRETDSKAGAVDRVHDEALTSADWTEVAESAGSAVLAMGEVREALLTGVRALTKEQAADLLDRDVFEEADPDTIIKACARYVDVLRETAAEIDHERTAQEIGYLLLMGVNQRLSWPAVVVEGAGREGTAVVVSPDRRYLADPVLAVYRLLRDPERDNNLALAINMLAAERFPPAEPQSYTVVLG